MNTPISTYFQFDASSLNRETRQIALDDDSLDSTKRNKHREIPGLGETANCNFGVEPENVNMCKWSNLNMSAFNWLSSSGIDSYWIGGPTVDDNERNKKGINSSLKTLSEPWFPEDA